MAALQVALVGMGRVARVHLEALRGTSAVDVVGVFDLNQARAHERAEAEQIARVYRSWTELLGDEHRPVRRRAAAARPARAVRRPRRCEAGKHVVCEKPLAPTLPECDRMLAAAAEVGRKLFPVHNRVYSLAVEQMQRDRCDRRTSAKSSWRRPPASKARPRSRRGWPRRAAEVAC